MTLLVSRMGCLSLCVFALCWAAGCQGRIPASEVVESIRMADQHGDFGPAPLERRAGDTLTISLAIRKEGAVRSREIRPLTHWNLACAVWKSEAASETETTPYGTSLGTYQPDPRRDASYTASYELELKDRAAMGLPAEPMIPGPRLWPEGEGHRSNPWILARHARLPPAESETRLLGQLTLPKTPGTYFLVLACSPVVSAGGLQANPADLSHLYRQTLILAP